MPLEKKLLPLVNIVKNSSFRILGLIDNLLDFARARMGSGFVLHRAITNETIKILQQVIAELQIIWPDRVIQTFFDLSKSLNVDTNRLGQLFSNLLSNALSYGTPGKPVQVTATDKHGQFRLTVSNHGEPIPASAMARLFTAFSRQEISPDRKDWNGIVYCG